MGRRARLVLVFTLAAGIVRPTLDSAAARAAPPPVADAWAEPELLLPPSMQLLRAAADATGVYATRYDADRGARVLLRRAPDGAVQLLAESPRVAELALDDGHVYWIGEDGVQAVPKTGGAVHTLAARDWTLVAEAPDQPRWGLALDGDDVYFSLDDGVGRVSKQGGESQALASGRGARVVGVDAVEVFWLEQGDGEGGPSTTSVLATLKRGGPSRRVLAHLPGVLAVAVADDGLYWLAETERRGVGAIHRASKSGDGATTLVGDVPTYYAQVLAVAAENLYWLDYPRGLHGPMRVRTVPTKGGDPTTLAEPFPVANKLLLDPRRVCWAQDGVRCVPRGPWDTAHLPL
jgi:hypothetical protein